METMTEVSWSGVSETDQLLFSMLSNPDSIDLSRIRRAAVAESTPHLEEIFEEHTLTSDRRPEERSSDEPRRDRRSDEPSFDMPRRDRRSEESSFDMPRRDRRSEEPSFDEPRRDRRSEEPSFDEPRRDRRSEEPSFDEPRHDRRSEEPSFDEPRHDRRSEEPSFDEPRRDRRPEEPSFDEPRRDRRPEEPSSDDPRRDRRSEEPSSDDPRRDRRSEEPSSDEPSQEVRHSEDSRPRESDGMDHRSKEDQEQVMFQKQSILFDLQQLRDTQNVQWTKEWTVNDSIEDLMLEIRRHTIALEERGNVNMMRDGMRMMAMGIEMLNSRFNLLDLEGWASEFSQDLSKHDANLARIYRKYWRKSTSSSPEFSIALAVCGSLGMHHAQRTMSKQMMNRTKNARYFNRRPEYESDEEPPRS